MLRLAEAARTTGLDLGHMRAIAVGGGPMSREALADAERALGVRFLRLFGMSECLGHTTVALDDAPELRLETEGYPFPGTEDLIVDASGAQVPAGTVGEIVVRGPSLMLGYAREGRLAAPELTASGHYITGDLGSIGSDGRLRITGRRKNIIMRAGKGVDAVEVETALMEHPAVVDACVVAVPHTTLGEQAAALVVAIPDAQVTKSELAAFLEARGMSKYKWPELVFSVDALPRTATGKLARATAAELARDLTAQHV
jgi:non-ribosomal peptide synthetase component E (peptide arylation enzyme)